LLERETQDVKNVTLIFALLLCSGLCHSQTYKLLHLEGNNYKVKTVYLNESNLCSVIYKNYDELEKDERGWVRVTVLDLRNDTLSIIEADSTQQTNRIPFKAGKRSGAAGIIRVNSKTARDEQ